MKCWLLLVLVLLSFSSTTWVGITVGEYEGPDLRGDPCRITLEPIVEIQYPGMDSKSVSRLSDSETRFTLKFPQAGDSGIQMSSTFIADRGLLTDTWENVTVYRSAAKKAVRMGGVHLQVDRNSGLPTYFQYQIISKESQERGECMRFRRVEEAKLKDVVEDQFPALELPVLTLSADELYQV